MKRGDKIIYNRPMPDAFRGGKWIYKNYKREAKVMAIADGYVMLRHPRCMPYIESLKDLEKWLIK